MVGASSGGLESLPLPVQSASYLIGKGSFRSTEKRPGKYWKLKVCSRGVDHSMGVTFCDMRGPAK